MTNQPKTAQLQIRISAGQKALIQRAARRAGMDMSAYVLARVLPGSQVRFDTLVHRLMITTDPAFELAELNDLLSNIGADQFVATTANPPPVNLTPQLANYVAAMVEYAAGRLGVRPPVWVRRIPPLDEPMFGTDLQSLRLYLLTHSPSPFRRRNIFVDASLGDRV
jgi:uncharacterized protein (DUF1778 family)